MHFGYIVDGASALTMTFLYAKYEKCRSAKSGHRSQQNKLAALHGVLLLLAGYKF